MIYDQKMFGDINCSRDPVEDRYCYLAHCRPPKEKGNMYLQRQRWFSVSHHSCFLPLDESLTCVESVLHVERMHMTSAGDDESQL